MGKAIFIPTDIHLSTRLCVSSIRFTWSPIYVDGNRKITPIEVFRLIHAFEQLQSDPNLIRGINFHSRKLQDKLVFFLAVDLYQVAAMIAAPLFGVRIRNNLISRFVTVVFKLLPAIGAGIWKRVAMLNVTSLNIFH